MTWRLFVLFAVVAALGVTLTQGLRVYFSQAQEIAEVRAQIETQRAEIERINDELTRWDDPAYVEAQARERLGWVMPGETGYRVIGLDGEPIGGDSTVFGQAEPTGLWWERMWGSMAIADQPAEHVAAETEQPAEDPAEKPTETDSSATETDE